MGAAFRKTRKAAGKRRSCFYTSGAVRRSTWLTFAALRRCSFSASHACDAVVCRHNRSARAALRGSVAFRLLSTAGLSPAVTSPARSHCSACCRPCARRSGARSIARDLNHPQAKYFGIGTDPGKD